MWSAISTLTVSRARYSTLSRLRPAGARLEMTTSARWSLSTVPPDSGERVPISDPPRHGGDHDPRQEEEGDGEDGYVGRLVLGRRPASADGLVEGAERLVEGEVD